MTSGSAGGRPPGPTDATREQVLQAAFRLLSDEGPDALTPSRLHQETGVARTTVYRHWPTPGDVVASILPRAIARDERGDLDGTLDHDLRVAVGSLLFRFRNRPVRRFHAAALQHGGPTMAERYVAGLVAPVRDVLAAAVERGDLAGDPDELTSTLCGPLLMERLLLGRAVDDDAVERRVTALLADRT